MSKTPTELKNMMEDLLRVKLPTSTGKYWMISQIMTLYVYKNKLKPEQIYNYFTPKQEIPQVSTPTYEFTDVKKKKIKSPIVDLPEEEATYDNVKKMSDDEIFRRLKKIAIKRTEGLKEADKFNNETREWYKEENKKLNKEAQERIKERLKKGEKHIIL